MGEAFVLKMQMGNVSVREMDRLAVNYGISRCLPSILLRRICYTLTANHSRRV